MTTSDVGDLECFCRQIEARSREHQQAMPVVVEHGWWSLAVGMLRLELDSLIRVIYLLHQPQQVRNEIIASSIAGDGRFRLETPRGRLTTATDADMLNAADRLLGLNGWVRRVYKFGCSFIHLSSAHDYLALDPFQALPPDERLVIAEYLRHYHGGTVDPQSTFAEVTPYVPKVLTKISSNLELYVDDLRASRSQG
ncbi:hypothetical protein AB0B31_25460 [Catellatospora citrea]|uniref:hypothetical protein n=1 Tax=Catellatospora citrea TaxID=53366 RepID=UPI0033D985C8